jgi:hypothetical protein
MNSDCSHARAGCPDLRVVPEALQNLHMDREGAFPASFSRPATLKIFDLLWIGIPFGWVPLIWIKKEIVFEKLGTPSEDYEKK